MKQIDRNKILNAANVLMQGGVRLSIQAYANLPEDDEQAPSRTYRVASTALKNGGAVSLILCPTGHPYNRSECRKLVIA